MTPQRQQRIERVLSKRQNDLTIVLENVFDPHNISAVLRTCDAVGIQEVYVLNTTIPLHAKWGARSSSSAKKWITIHQLTLSNVLASFVNDTQIFPAIVGVFSPTTERWLMKECLHSLTL